MELPSTGPIKQTHDSRVEDIDESNKESVDVEKDIPVTRDHEHDEGPQTWTMKSMLAVASLGLVFVGAQTPLFFMAASLAYIVPDVNPGQKSSWIVVGYILAAATPVPFAGYLQDIFGRRWMTMTATCVVILGSILIGTAHNFPHILAGSILAGAGAGIAELGSIAGVSEVVPIKHRGYINGTMLLVSLPFGPYVLYGQLLASRATWRWGMWIACIIEGLALAGTFFTYFPSRHSRMEGLTKWQMLKRIDWVGGSLLTIGLTLFLVACQSGGSTHAWNSAYILCTLLFGIFTLIGFGFWEAFVPTYPLVPRELVKRKIILIAFIVAFVAGMFYYSLSNFGPIYFSNVYASDPVTIGLRNTPFPTLVVTGAIIGNFLISKFPNHIAYTMAGFCALMTLSGGLFIMGDPTNPQAVTAFASLAGLGCGGIVVPVATVCVIASPDDLIATTIALTLAVRIFGGTIGYSVYSNIFSNKLTSNLPTLVGQYAVEAGLPEASLVDFITAFLATPPDPSLATIPGVTPEVIASAALGAQWAFSESLKYVFIASIPFGVLATVSALFLRDLNKYMTNRVIAHLHG